MTARPRPRVLVVEDERIVAQDLQEELAAMGYDATAVAASAEEAIARASERCPDLVLMDIRIQGKLDGIDTAHLLRARFGTALVYLTAHADEATLARAKQTEPHGYLLKPVRAAELRGAIEMALAKNALERQQRERERWFATTLDAIGDAVLAVDHAGRISLANEAAARLVGIVADEIVGRPATDILPLAGVPHERFVVGDGAQTGEVLVFRDMTEQRALAQRLEGTDRLASLGALAAGVAHEVNNPLSVVVANAAYIAEELARIREEFGPAAAIDEAIAAQTELLGATERITRILGDMRDFARPGQDTEARADVGAAIARALRTTGALLRDRARVITDVVPLPAVACDEPRLAQVIVNLISNAAQAIAPGAAARNAVTIRGRATADGRVEIEVEDTGAGIAPDVLARVFEPFFTTKPVGVGTGLGLAVCRGIVTSLGGEITATSRVGQGTTMRVRLPTADPPAERAAPEPRARVLVIDDEEPIRRALGRMLREHEVVTAASASEGLALLAAGPRFDVIFTDLGMPGMTGLELYEHLHATRSADARRVVLVSGGELPAELRARIAATGLELLEKPVRAQALAEAIGRVRARAT